MSIALIILAILLAVPLVMLIIGASLSGPRYRGPVSEHFDGTKFINHGGVKAKGGFEVIKWMLGRNQGPWHEAKEQNFGMHPLGHFKGGIRVTFVNHSTFLIQADGVNILTDPVWSKRVSPFRWIGPRRMAHPGIRFEDLPRIHLVLLTHNHYDHLDIDTMRMVFGAHHPRIIVPLGIKKFLDLNSISSSIEMDWWEEAQVNDVTIQSLPAQHFSGRGMLDRDATLWCGYAIKSRDGNIYFAGDTGYNDEIFREIGARSGPFKISMLPIGAYKPEWFMSPIHVSPDQAVQIHLDVQSQQSIGMHFGTFPLADDGESEPATQLQLALEKFNVSQERFVVLKAGEVRVYE